MKHRPLPAQDTKRLLHSGGLRNLYSQARRLGFLQKRLDEQLDAPEKGRYRVAAWDGEVLTLLAQDGAWATHLRYRQHLLLKQLSTLAEMCTLKKICIKVRPAIIIPTPASHRPHLSLEAAREIQAAADSITSPELRAALQRLSRRGKNDGSTETV